MAQRRTRVDLTADLAEQFRIVAQRRGHQRAVLAYAWVGDAAWMAANGRATLPRGTSVPTGTPMEKIEYAQTAEESAEWGRVIAAAGSSVRAVLAEAIRQYLAVDGDRLKMSWPQPRRRLKAAS